MSEQEQKLIEAIKAKPGYQVFPGSPGSCAIRIAQQLPNGVRSHSVWLGKPNAIPDLERIANA